MTTSIEANLQNNQKKVSAQDPHPIVSTPLRTSVKQAVEKYLAHLDGQPVNHLYEIVMSEVEEALLQKVMELTNYNKSKATAWLGLNRGTLYKKLARYDLSGKS